MKDDAKVRIVVKKVHGGGHHGGAWKVAYADFVTTMMALFIVLWIIGQNSAVKASIAGYFRDPGAFKEGRAPAPVPGGAGLLPGAPAEAGGAAPADPEGEAEKQALQAAAERIEALTAAEGPFPQLAGQITISITPEGLRIELREHERRPFFEVGSTALVHPLEPLLHQLQAILGGLPNHITVEGHTDARQYATRKHYSNWELSADRANSARRVMEAAGMRPGHIDRIVGHADRLPVVAEDPMHASNRRISLLVRREHAGAPDAAAAAPGDPAAAGAAAPARAAAQLTIGPRPAMAAPAVAASGTSPAAPPAAPHSHGGPALPR